MPQGFSLMLIRRFANYNVSSKYEPLEESLVRQDLTGSKIVAGNINN